MSLIANNDTAIVAPVSREGQRNPRTSLASFNRPSNTTIYNDNDVIADSTTSAIEFPECGKSGLLQHVLLMVEETDTIDFDLFVFDTEPTNIADNAALALVSSDLTKLVAVFNFDDADKINVGTNIEVYPEAGANTRGSPYSYVTASGSLYGILVTRTIWSPLSAMEFNLRLQLDVT